MICKAILIDAARREIREVDYEPHGPRDVRTALECNAPGICVGWAFTTGDILYVNDEGILHPARTFFRWRPRPDGMPYVGNGLIVGREVEDFDNDTWYTENPEVTIEELRDCVEWIDRRQAAAWALEHADDPGQTITTFGHDGKPGETVVTTTMGELWANALRDEDE